MKKFVFWALVAVLVSGAALGVYVWQQGRLDDRDGTISTLKLEVEELKSQNQKKPSEPSNPSTKDDSQTFTSKNGVKVSLYSPFSGAKVTSPLGVVGQVPGSWSFEASFPVILKDSRGTVVARGTATLLGDWMTDRLVPFSVKLTYSTRPSGTGELILQKDNPSGEQKNDDSVTIPILF